LTIDTSAPTKDDLKAMKKLLRRMGYDVKPRPGTGAKDISTGQDSSSDRDKRNRLTVTAVSDQRRAVQLDSPTMDSGDVVTDLMRSP